MKYLVLFYLTEMLKEMKHAAQMHTHAFPSYSSHDSTGVCSLRSPFSL